MTDSSAPPISEAMTVFEGLLAAQNTRLDQLDAEQAVAALARFYEEFRFAALADYGGKEDMLLGEWGDLDGSGARIGAFIRQFILGSGVIMQLQLKLTYASPPGKAGSSDWQLTADGFRQASSAMVAALSGRPTEVSLRLDRM